MAEVNSGNFLLFRHVLQGIFHYSLHIAFLGHFLPLVNNDKITKIFAIGEVTHRLAQELGNDFQVIEAQDLVSVLKLAKENHLKGNLVFSPAFPSFDQFKNYVDRGEKFKGWVKEILI